jgi:hypothetical protein
LAPNKFSKISDINIENKFTWYDKVFLTFDIDWAHDDVLNYSIDIVEKADVSATWFITHKTALLDRLRENPKFELGVHPNFNFLLNGDFRNGSNYVEVVERLLEIVPEAKSVRSHSVTQSSYILQLFVEKGLKYDCNHFIPAQAEIELKPWKLWNGLTKVPYYWEDDVACICRDSLHFDLLLNRKGIKVFDFHPIHVYLNTEDMKRYEESRSFHRQTDNLLSLKYNGLGTENHLLKLLGL